MWYFGLGYAGLYFPPIAARALGADEEHLALAIHMRVVTGGTTRPVQILRQQMIAMRMAPRVVVPMTRGVAQRVDIPMRVGTTAWLEKT